MSKWLSIVKGVSFLSSMITQMVSVLHWAAIGEKDFVLCPKEISSERGGGTQQHFSCNALTDCKMFFKPFDSECNSSRCGCNCLDISSLFCSLAAAALPPQTACVLPSLLFGLQGQRWLSEIKLWNHIFRQDQMLSVSAFDMTARFVTQPTYFQHCCCQPSPDIGFSVAMPPSTILFFFFCIQVKLIIVDWMFSCKHCSVSQWTEMDHRSCMFSVCIQTCKAESTSLILSTLI